MSTILDEIVTHKRKETEEKKSLYPAKLLERSLCFSTQPVSFRKYLLREDSYGIIAEFKRKSPSKGILNAYADAEKTTLSYMQAGASALSVLTDEKYFGGKNADVESARRVNYCPILRKDFVVDEYQILEAKSIGADAILLIAAVLTKEEINNFSSLAISLGMEVLIEIHAANEIEKIAPQIQLVGVNNRNLKTFEVDVRHSFELSKLLPKEMTWISESGISDPFTVCDLFHNGFQGFLMGETFMKTPHPGKACGDFIAQVKKLYN